MNSTVLLHVWYCLHLSSLEWCGTAPSLTGMGQCLSLAVVQLCPHGHNVQEAEGARGA